MNKKFDLLVFIGRFQPFHYGHKAVVDQALSEAERVLIIIGSSTSGRSPRNPWTAEERMNMISKCFSPEQNNRIDFAPVPDYPYTENKWLEEIQRVVYFHTCHNKDLKIGLIGHSKDHTGYYLKLFPQWESVPVNNFMNINATDIRKILFEKNINWENISPLVSNTTLEFLNKFRYSEEFKFLLEEYEYINNYKKAWALAPYPPTFQTVDACVVQSGHVLLVRRKAAPGKGLWAMPGGFIQPDETLLQAMLRELREETKIKVPEPVLRGNIQRIKTYDDPLRSARGRVITQAYLIKLPNDTELPKVRGSDDAEKAKWFQIYDLEQDKLFEDHYNIITDLLGI